MAAFREATAKLGRLLHCGPTVALAEVGLPTAEIPLALFSPAYGIGTMAAFWFCSGPSR